MGTRLNDLPAGPQSWETYEELRKVCTFGSAPIGGKVVMQMLCPSYGRQRYRIVSNPIGLDAEHLALFCDGGNLPFGYTTNGNVIEVYTD